MNETDFRDYLAPFLYSDEQVAACIAGVKHLEDHLGSILIEDCLGEATVTYVDYLRHIDQLDRQHLVGVYFYANMVGNIDLERDVLEMLDGFEILGNLSAAVEAELGPDAHAEVFAGVELPEIGTTPRDWIAVNAVVFPRLETAAEPETIKRILRSGLRNLPDANFLPMRERFEEMGDIDDFLEDRGRRRYEGLVQHRYGGTLYFNQLINDEVLAFVAAHPEIGRGVRDGTTIIETKIPHEAIEYLAATDFGAQQYHVCHCPLVKESMAPGGPVISDGFCDFCPSFNAKPWEVIFDQKLEYEVLESAKRGGRWCRFAIHLPAEGMAATPLATR